MRAIYPDSKKNWRRRLLLVACVSLTICGGVAQAQTASSATPLAPGPKPSDAPLEWKQLVGIYEYKNEYTSREGKGRALPVVFLERNQHLFRVFQTLAQSGSQHDQGGEVQESHGAVWIADADDSGKVYAYSERRDDSGRIIALTYLAERYTRTDAGADSSRFYHITPAKPIDQLRAAALASKPPKEHNKRKPELVELAPLDPAFHLDIRYAQSNNFLSTPVYTQSRTFLQRPAAEALLRVLHKLQPFGYGLLIHDAYRPWYVTKIFWDATPPEGKIFVADPQKGSKHNRGCAVDITLYDLATGKPAEMPGLYDEMSPRSFPNFPGGTSLQRWNRDLLRRAMESEGFTVNEAEWWHFDYKDWKQYPILNTRFEDLAVASEKSK
jgi:zinc D-Ala-D-Ala dipeptidase